jgi:hypothetical protein
MSSLFKVRIDSDMASKFAPTSLPLFQSQLGDGIFQELTGSAPLLG